MENNFWQKTYVENAPLLLGICYRYVSDRALAEDLMHEAFLTAMSRIDTYSGKGSFQGWLRKIAVNTALLYLRHSPPQDSPPFDFPEEEDPYLSSGDDIRTVIEHARFTSEELLNAIKQLPSPYREVFNLYVLDEYSHAEISEILNIKVGTSKSYLARARKKIQHLLYEEALKNKQRFEIVRKVETHAYCIINSRQVHASDDTLLARVASDEKCKVHFDSNIFLYELFKLEMGNFRLHPSNPLNFS